MAFTLVELLASVAIIGVLVTLLFAGFETVKSSIKSATCISNLRQLGSAAASYSGDNNQRTLPPNFYGALVDGGYLPKLTKTAVLSRSGVWMCPKDDKDRSSVTEAKANHITSISYGYNGQRIGLPPTYWDTSKILLNNVEKPSQTLYLADCDSYYMNKSAANQNGAFRHRGKINILFFDGHVAPEIQPSPVTDFYNQFL